MTIHTEGTCLHTREACPFIREEKCSSIREEYDIFTRKATGILDIGGACSFIWKEHKHDP